MRYNDLIQFDPIVEVVKTSSIGGGSKPKATCQDFRLFRRIHKPETQRQHFANMRQFGLLQS